MSKRGDTWLQEITCLWVSSNTNICLLHQDEVLMVQEAKQDCYKQWYLPAGRVEVGESLEEALKREVRHTHTGPLLKLQPSLNLHLELSSV